MKIEHSIKLNCLGVPNAATPQPLKANQTYNVACFTWDNSCDLTKDLRSVDDRCQCYDQLTYRNATRYIQYPNSFYCNRSNCICPSYSYLYNEFDKYMSSVFGYFIVYLNSNLFFRNSSKLFSIMFKCFM
jgi:hypothetical protein